MNKVDAETAKSDGLLDQFSSSLRTVEKIESASKGDKIIVNLEDLEWASPTYLGPISCKVNEIENSGRNTEIIPPDDNSTEKYLETVNFPQGGETIDHKNQTYLPICRIGKSGKAGPIDKSIDKIRSLLKQKLNNPKGNVLDSIFYPISETIDNVCEHSECSEGSLLAQYYPEKDFVDICVSDNGISIPGNYERHNFRFKNDEEAIDKAMRGLSTKSKERGFGLKTITNLIVDGLNGEIIISSRKGSAYRSRNKESSPSHFVWDGTIVSLRLKVPNEDFHFYSYLE